MSITLTNRETRPDATTARLISFTANVVLRYAEAHFQVGFGSGEDFAETRRTVLYFSDNEDAGADYTFRQLINAVSEVRDLKNALEVQAIALNLFEGTVNP